METLGHPAVPLGLWVLRVQRRNLNSLETEKEELSAAPWAEILFYTFSEKKKQTQTAYPLLEGNPFTNS